MRFIGVDLAWKARNPTGVAVLEGARFPLRLFEAPRTLPTHAAVLDWLASELDRDASQLATAVGIDAPLLGLASVRGRRACDDEVSRLFGRFAASVHNFSAFRAMLERFVVELTARCARVDLCPQQPATVGCPVIREVYPNALQVRLFDLDRPPGRRKHAYKRRRFNSKRDWVVRGLGPFVAKCAAAVESRHYVARDRVWQAFVREKPRAGDAEGALKAVEDRWDALLCALAVALQHLEPGAMRAYTGSAPESWCGGYILAPILRPGRMRGSP